ncbi:MAG: hypothetical protein LBK99_15435 [Opitutaceae bacterium]|jgi:hypothetical protein|nr:hypothetical protein [Opitutaceae bacterium]
MMSEYRILSFSFVVATALAAAATATTVRGQSVPDDPAEPLPFLVNRFVFAHGAPYHLPAWEKKEKWYEFRVDPKAGQPATDAIITTSQATDTVDIIVSGKGKTWKSGYTIGPHKVYRGDRVEVIWQSEGLDDNDLTLTLNFREGVPHAFKKTRPADIPLAPGMPGASRAPRPPGLSRPQPQPAGFRTAAFEVGDGHAGLYLNELVTTLRPSSAGRSTLKLHSLAIWRQPVDNRLDADAILRTPPANDARVVNDNGVINVHLDGHPINFMAYESMLPQQFGNYDAQLNQAGFGITRFGIVLGEDVYLRFHPPTWVGPRQYDFTWLDRKLGALLALKPGNKVVLAVILDGADWWTRLNPDSAGIHDYTTHVTGYHGPTGRGRNSYPGIPDYQSGAWKRDAREAVRQMVAHIRQSSYGDAVIGYELFGGYSMDCNFEVNDSTPAAIERFRAMLREKYVTDSALQKAWRRPAVTLATAMPEHLVTDAHPMASLKTPLIPDLAGRQAYLDSKRFREIAFQEIILDFGRWIKEATHGRALVGARTGNFMGHLWSWGEKQEMRENRNNPVDLLCKSPDFDFFDVQEPYIGRHNPGYQGTGSPVTALRGLALDGKLLLIQDDVPHEVAPASRRTDELYLTRIKRRIFVNCLVTGSIPYQWEMGHYKLAHPYLLKEFRAQQDVMNRAVNLPRDSVAEIAFVFDRGWQKYLGVDDIKDRPTRMVAFMDLARWTWDRAGAPADSVFIDQLQTLRPYKLYIFFNTFGITPEQEEIINRTVKRDGKVVLFTWADAFSTPEGHDAGRMSRVTGIRIAASPKPRSWKMTPTAFFARNTKISGDFPPGVLTRTKPGESDAAEWTFSPSFTVTDPVAKALATYSGSDDVALAQKQQGGWTSIYSASAILSPSLLRHAAKQAGVHSYTETEDALYVNRSFVGIHAKDTSEIRLAFPAATPLYEVFSRTELPSSATHLIKAEADQTCLYFKGTRAQWNSVPD